jgi:hypothetical protein
MKTTTLPIRNSTNYSPLRRTLILIPLVLMCCALSPRVRAVTPAPDGGYPGGNTAEGTDALFSLTSGIDNTALGFEALFHNTAGNFNTAEGFAPSFATPPAFRTPPPVSMPLSPTPPAFKARPPALMPLSPTPPAFRTRPSACKRYSATQPDFTTESLVNEISLRLLFGRLARNVHEEILSPGRAGRQPDNRGCVDA